MYLRSISRCDVSDLNALKAAVTVSSLGHGCDVAAIILMLQMEIQAHPAIANP